MFTIVKEQRQTRLGPERTGQQRPSSGPGLKCGISPDPDCGGY